MQGARGTLDVIADDLRAVAVTGRDAADESGHQGELPPEHVVDYEHFAAAEVRLRITCCQAGHHLPLLIHVARYAAPIVSESVGGIRNSVERPAVS